MWMKCPRTREIKVLLDAYRQKYNPTSEFFHLTHQGVRRDRFDVVGFLEDGDNVVMLKAVDGPAWTWEEEQAVASVRVSAKKSSAARRVLETKLGHCKEQLDDGGKSVDKADEDLEAWEEILSK